MPRGVKFLHRRICIYQSQIQSIQCLKHSLPNLKSLFKTLLGQNQVFYNFGVIEISFMGYLNYTNYLHFTFEALYFSNYPNNIQMPIPSSQKQKRVLRFSLCQKRLTPYGKFSKNCLRKKSSYTATAKPQANFFLQELNYLLHSVYQKRKINFRLKINHLAGFFHRTDSFHSKKYVAGPF